MTTRSADPMDEESRRLIGRRLAEARLRQALTQQQVADVVGVASDTVRRWENGKQLPVRYYWQNLCTLYQTTPEALFRADPPAPAPTFSPSKSLTSSSPAQSAPLTGATPSRRRPAQAIRPLRVLLLLLLFLASLLIAPASVTLPASQRAVAPLIGSVVFQSSGHGKSDHQGIMDELHIVLAGLVVPAKGAGYYAWMAKASGSAETRWQPLGWLMFSPRTATLLYRDPQRRNLLSTFSRFLITQEQASIPPLQPSTTWVAQASISTVPAPRDPHHYSLLNHLQHLLAADPALERLHLQKGLVTYLAANTEAVQQEAASLVPDWHAGHFVEVRACLIRILDWLDGSAAVSADVPSGTPFLAPLPAARIGLLTLSPTENPPGYVLHTDLHLEGVATSPGASLMQQEEAKRLRIEMNAIALALSTMREDALPLVRMPFAELARSTTLSSLIALDNLARTAWNGTAETPGVAQVSADIAQLATIPFQQA